MKLKRRLHRLLGIILALPLAWLCVSGILLNHASDLALNRKHLTSPWLLAHYVAKPSDEGATLAIGSRRVSQWGDSLFLDQKLLPFAGKLVGAIAMEPNLLIATTDRLYLLGPNSELLDQLDSASLPISSIASLQSEPVPAISDGSGSFTFDRDLLDFSPISKNVPGQALAPLSANQQDSLYQTLAAQTPVSYARVLLDWHKFSFLGPFARWTLTVSTVGLLVLLVTGLVLLNSPRRKKAAASQS